MPNYTAENHHTKEVKVLSEKEVEKLVEAWNDHEEVLRSIKALTPGQSHTLHVFGTPLPHPDSSIDTPHLVFSSDSIWQEAATIERAVGMIPKTDPHLALMITSLVRKAKHHRKEARKSQPDQGYSDYHRAHWQCFLESAKLIRRVSKLDL